MSHSRRRNGGGRALRLTVHTGPIRLRREPLVWIGSAAIVLEPGLPVPLVQHPMPSITRQPAVECL